ncbi:MAG: hypothetical protein V7746_22265 [Halioglobus sp.]
MSRVLKIGAIALQLGLLIILVRAFQIESGAFQQLLFLMLGGFVVNALLPLRYRKSFFALLSLSGILLVMGLASGLWIIALGFLLIGICHLPCAFGLRIALIVIVTGLLAVSRLEWIQVPWSGAVWPILGSMFMFRLIVYLYDLKHEKNTPALSQIVSYFFMLPNVCFPLFPVIDFKKFNSLYYNEDDFRIYQRGIKWMFRGVVHLLLYRYVYYNLTLDPAEVDGLSDMVQFSLSSFLLYLRVSGLFHLIIGMLLMFGFNLPETHHLYYLASGFAEFWRRINIYWKDFMMKIFYYPMRFKLRKMGEVQAIVVSTLVVFFLTWFLHAWQWFWLRGTMLLEWHDALFWAILAVLVIVNSIYETKTGMNRSLGGSKRSIYSHAATVARVAATFTSICILWSMWSSDTLSQWISMWETTGYGWLWFAFGIPAFYVAGNLFSRADKKRQTKTAPQRRLPKPPKKDFWMPVAISCCLMLGLYGLRQPVVYSALPSQAALGVESIVKSQLNNRDMAQMQRGYYEHLISVNRNNLDLWAAFNNRPKDWVPYRNLGGWQATNDFMTGELLPGAEVTFKGAQVRVNELGMRDRERTEEKPIDTWRAAMLGASYVFGSGVENEENFPTILEGLLNESSEIAAFPDYEVLNFGVPERLTIRQLMALEDKVLDFEPDVVVYVAHTVDSKFTLRYIGNAVRSRVDMPYPFLSSIVERAGVTPDMTEFEIEKRLTPFIGEVLAWTYGEIARVSRENGIFPVWVLLPLSNEDLTAQRVAELSKPAEDAGFLVVDLSGVYGDHPEDIVIAEWDDHPNGEGHRMIANALYDIFLANSAEIFRSQKQSEGITTLK